MMSAKLKNKKSMRFEAEWLLECMLLRIKSKSAYEGLRKSGLIPLPHKDTLRKLISGMSCHFGFNPEALDAIKQAMAGKRPEDRQVVLCFDEMCITPSLNFNAETLAFDGFVKLTDGPVENEDKEELEVNEDKQAPVSGHYKVPPLADHALVFMCRPLVSPPEGAWVQPFGVFASKGAAPGEDLFRLVVASIIRLDVQGGANVLVIVNDGAQTNKTVWKLGGIKIEKSNERSPSEDIIVNKMRHPTITGEDVHFLQDPPHIFKCIRNQFYNHATVQCRGKAMTPHQLIRDLYEVDSVVGEGRLCPKLRRIHVDPTPFQRMNVKVAVQVTSLTVISAAQVYQKIEKTRNDEQRAHFGNDAIITEKFQNIEPTLKLFRLLNDVLDIMNARCPKDGINKTNWQKKKEVLLEFNQVLKETDEFDSSHEFRKTVKRKPSPLLITESQKKQNNVQEEANKENNIAKVLQKTGSNERRKSSRIVKKMLPKELPSSIRNSDATTRKCTKPLAVKVTRKVGLQDVTNVSHPLPKQPKSDKIQPFISKQTNKAMRITIQSVIDLVELLLSHKFGFKYVLTGKFNQDCLERFFGIIRSANGGENKPTFSSFLQLFRLLSLYYPTRRILRDSNVDSEEPLQLLTSYADWLKKKFKEKKDASAQLKCYVKDILLEGLKVEIEEANCDVPDQSTRNSNIIYYIVGYLVFRFKKGKKHCEDCLKTMDTGFENLPEDFTAKDFTSFKNKGNLRFPSTTVFKLLSKVEFYVTDFTVEGDIYKENSFQDILYTLCVDSLPKVGCDIHYLTVMTNLIYDFLLVRYRFVGKESTYDVTEDSLTKKHKNSKLSKAV